MKMRVCQGAEDVQSTVTEVNNITHVCICFVSLGFVCVLALDMACLRCEGSQAHICLPL